MNCSCVLNWFPFQYRATGQQLVLSKCIEGMNNIATSLEIDEYLVRFIENLAPLESNKQLAEWV